MKSEANIYPLIKSDHERYSSHFQIRWFGEDVLQFISILDLTKNNLIDIGHSLGGYSLTLAAAIAPKRLFQSLILCDPIIFPEFMYGSVVDYSSMSRRKNQWSSIEDMISYGKTESIF